MPRNPPGKYSPAPTAAGGKPSQESASFAAELQASLDKSLDSLKHNGKLVEKRVVERLEQEQGLLIQEEAMRRVPAAFLAIELVLRGGKSEQARLTAARTILEYASGRGAGQVDAPTLGNGWSVTINQFATPPPPDPPPDVVEAALEVEDAAQTSG